MTKVFLTGAAGFIGSHLIPVLLARGIDVVGFDNLSTGRFPDIREFITDNPKATIHPTFKFFSGDLTDDGDHLRKCMAGCDLVWHLGANTLIPPGAEDRAIDLENNVIGTFNVLEAMKANEIKEIIFASTAATYGDELLTLSEKWGPMRPISLYGASKLACEAFISAYSHLFGIKASIYRFSNVVGGGMGHGVAYDLIQKLKKTPGNLPIWGDGRGHKPYMLVEDCIRGMFIGHAIPDDRRQRCEIFNLGCPTTTKVSRVAEIVCEEMGLTPTFDYAGGRQGFPGDVPCVNYDASKMDRFGWRVSCTSDEAVRSAARRILDGKP